MQDDGTPARRPGWGRRGRLRAAIETGLAAQDRLRLAERLPWWHLLDRADRGALERLTAGLLAAKDFEAARGFDLDDSMRLLIAAQASLPLIGLARRDGAEAALDHYRDVTSVIVHPTTVVQRHERPTGMRHVVTNAAQHLLGQAQLHGPVLLAWDAVVSGMSNPGRGRNVVVHEFAHKLDMRDGAVNGTPMLGDRSLRGRWHDLATQELRQLRAAPDPVLDRYGAQNPAEFFAVVMESFLDDPVKLAEHKPEFYDVLVGLFAMDPAAIVRRLGAEPWLTGLGLEHRAS